MRARPPRSSLPWEDANLRELGLESLDPATSAVVAVDWTAAVVEVVGLVPLVLLVGLICLQGLAIGATAVRADNAAHAAAVAFAERGAGSAAAAARAAGGAARCELGSYQRQSALVRYAQTLTTSRRT